MAYRPEAKDDGKGGTGSADSFSERPHLLQNTASGILAWPQCGHFFSRISDFPQRLQKLESSGFSIWQCWHFKENTSGRFSLMVKIASFQGFMDYRYKNEKILSPDLHYFVSNEWNKIFKFLSCRALSRRGFILIYLDLGLPRRGEANHAPALFWIVFLL
jgi:hypothetical protein